ncbi:hypothetical protein ZIOFF_053636 [Zingiber officinale]|uniref:J domain-containing protein n=1 Tax=Zingiber officinale TaxID=94328 RepID=A0A8J5FJ26_ZINOF|nr:hypothetical protein ZIOFF_053636 [Zingiber officinale]
MSGDGMGLSYKQRPCSITIAPPRLDSFPRSQRLRVSAGATVYELLSMAKMARPEEIKAAYRRQARRWYPDECCGADKERSYVVEKFMQAR